MGSSFSKQGKAMRDSASISPDDACKKEACAIQACLSKKNYNPDACTHEIEKLKRCCEGVQHAPIVRALPAVESASSYEVETVIEAAEEKHVTVMPIAGLKSSRWDPCRDKAQYLEQCMGHNDFNPAECQPQLADLKKCCERYQGKSIHCGFDPAVDPPDKHDVPLPDPDIPVKFKPAAPATLGPGAKVKAAESFTPPTRKDSNPAAPEEARTQEQHNHEASAAKGDTYLSLETKEKRDDAKERAAQPGLAKAVSSAAAKLLHPGGDTEQQPTHADPEECAQHGSSSTGVSQAQGTGTQSEQAPQAHGEHAGARSAVPGAAKEADEGVERDNAGTEHQGSESADDSQPHILDERVQMPFIPKGTRGYYIIYHEQTFKPFLGGIL